MDKHNQMKQKSFVPIQLYISSSAQTLYNCCDEWINLLISLKGETQVITHKDKVMVKDGEIMVLPPLTPIVSEHERNTFLLILKLDPLYFDVFYEGFSKLDFKRTDGNGDVALKHFIANIVKISLEYKPERRLELEQYLLDLAALLYHQYRVTMQGEETDTHGHALQVIKYIRNHLKESLSLPSIAAHVHLNEQYLSRYFSTMMGMTLLEYIRMQRLYDSMNALKYSKDTIVEISENSGFANVKSYYKAFKKYFDLTPTQYRRLCDQSGVSITAEDEHFVKHSALEQLYLYRNPECEMPDGINRPVLLKTIKINTNNRLGSLVPVWQKILTFSRASDGLRGEMRSQLELVQREIPFSFVRFHGIFSDGMGIYNEDEEGIPYYNFTYADELIDFLLHIKLRPYLELGFMPEQLASQKKYLFAWQANVSAPKDIGKWQNLIETFVKHLISRYGIEEVSAWYFEIWNDSDFPHKFATVPISDKFPMFLATYEALRRTEPRIRVGGVNTYEVLLSAGLLDIYFKFFKKNNITLDFISMSIYGIETEQISNSMIHQITRFDNKDFMIPQKLTDGATYMKRGKLCQVVDNLTRWIREHTDYKGELIINEWNLTPNPQDLINDTAFKAPFFVENVLDTLGKVNAIAYWTFSDIFDEVKHKSRLFHGGIGFLTEAGLKKPVYYALEFLKMLSGEIIFKDENILATKEADGSIFILLYNYCELYSAEIMTDENMFYDRNKAFHNQCLDIQIVLDGLEGEFQKNTYRIHCKDGSVFDEWLKIGAPKTLRPVVIKQLESKSLYRFQTQAIKIAQNGVVQEELEAHEVRLIQLIPREYVDI